MKIYFAGSIRGGRDDKEIYLSLIEKLQTFGTVLTEHIGDQTLTDQGEYTRTIFDIYERDMEWLREADVIVAEVTTPSLGVGYEVGQAESMKKPIVCLYRKIEGKSLSAMISGNSYITVIEYADVEDAAHKMKTFFESLEVST
jgi:nucleoside 2-deoxyribosyltransferase